jgi:hypothetical protein
VTTARVLLVAMLLAAVLAGAGMWYLQVYAFYEPVEPPETVPLATASGRLLEVAPVDFEGIDAASSPIRYRACLRLPPEAGARDLVPFADPRPPVAPGWFDCFDASAIGEALERREARAVLGQKDVTWGIDRVLVLFPDGRAYAWNQINACGAVVFDGEPVPDGCPPLPERD